MLLLLLFRVTNKQKALREEKRKEGRELRHPAGYQILFGCQAEDTNPYPTNTKKRTKICIMLKNFEFDFN
jgi:hypothetical protein